MVATESRWRAPAWQNYTIDVSDLDESAAHVAPGQGAGGYYGGIIGAFGFTIANQTLPSADEGTCPAGLVCRAFGGPSAPPNDSDPDGVCSPISRRAACSRPFFRSTVTFYIDDIEFQKGRHGRATVRSLLRHCPIPRTRKSAMDGWTRFLPVLFGI